MARGGHNGLGDLVGRWHLVDLRVGDEKRAVFVHHQTEGRDGVQAFIAQDLLHVIEVPEILAEDAADHRIRLAALDNHRRDCRRISPKHG